MKSTAAVSKALTQGKQLVPAADRRQPMKLLAPLQIRVSQMMTRPELNNLHTKSLNNVAAGMGSRSKDFLTFQKLFQGGGCSFSLDDSGNREQLSDCEAVISQLLILGSCQFVSIQLRRAATFPFLTR
jgi:hypothetical protein